MRKLLVLINLGLLLLSASIGWGEGAKGAGGGVDLPPGANGSAGRINSAEVEELVNAELLEHYEVAELLRRRGELERAIEAYQKILDSDQDGLVMVDPGGSCYISVKQSVLSSLRSSGEEGLRLYRQSFDDTAETCIRKAVETGDTAAMKKVADRFALTSHGARAMKLLGEIYFDSGRLADALAVWARLDAVWPDEIDAVIHAKLAAAYTFTGDHAAARRELAILRGTPQQALRTSNAGRFVEYLSSRVEHGGGARAKDGETWDWPVWGGDGTHACKAAAIGPISGLLKAADFDRYGYRGISYKTLQSLQAIPSPIEVVGSGERIYISTGYAVICYSLWGEGEPLWVYAGSQGAFDPQQFARNRVAITLDGDRLYSVLHQSSSGKRRLVCLNSGTGRLIWTAGERRQANEERRLPAGVSMQGSPVVKGESVYIMGHVQVAPGKQEYCLISFNRRDGALHWSRLISREVRSPWGAWGGAFGPLDSYSAAVYGDRVYCVTNAGTIAAVDANSGVLAWVAKYPRPEPDAMGWYNKVDLRAARGRYDYKFGWRDVPPILMGGRLYAAPRDGKSLFCLDAATGEVLWTFERAFGPAGATLEHARGSQARWAAQIIGVDPERQRLFLAGEWMLYVLDCNRDGALAAAPQEIPDGGIFGQGCVAGGRIYVPTMISLYEVDVEELFALEPNERYGWRRRIRWDEAAARAGIEGGNLGGNLAVVEAALVSASTSRLGVFYNWQERYQRLCRAIQEAPDAEKPHPLMLRAKVMLNERKYEEAVADLRRAFEIANGIAKEREGFDWTAAEILWQGKALSARGRNVGPFTHAAAEAREGLSLVYRQWGDQIALARMKAIEPGTPGASVPKDVLTAVEKGRGMYVEASRYAVLDQSLIKAFIAQARCDEAIGNWAGVVDVYQTILSRCPRSQFDFRPSDPSDRTGGIRDVVRYCRVKIAGVIAAQGRAPYQPHDERARIDLLRSNKTLKELDAVISQYPNSLAAGEAMMLAADLAMKEADASRAVRYWRSYIHLVKDGPLIADAYKNLVEQYERTNRLSDARETLLELRHIASDPRIAATVDGRKVEAKSYVEGRLAEPKFAAAASSLGSDKWQEAWHYDLPPGSRYLVTMVRRTSPVGSGPTPIIFAAAAANDRYTWTVFCYDPQTGTRRWMHTVHAVLGLMDVKYAGDSLYVADGKEVRRIDVAGGDVVWRRGDLFAGMEFQPQRIVQVDGLVYTSSTPDAGATMALAATADELSVVVATGEATRLAGLNPRTGEELWTTVLPALAGPVQMRPGYLMLPVRGSSQGTVQVAVIDSTRGDPIFNTSQEELIDNERIAPGEIEGLIQNDFSLAAGEGKMYMFAGKKVICYSLVEGGEVWRRPLSYTGGAGRHYSAVPLNYTAMRVSRDFISLIAQDKRLFALDKNTGEVKWAAEADDHEVLIDCPLCNERLFVITANEPVRAVPPGMVRIAGDDLRLKAIDPRSGDVIGNVTIQDVLRVRRIIVAGDKLLILCEGRGVAGGRGSSRIYVVDGRTVETEAVLGSEAGGLPSEVTDVEVVDGLLVVTGPAGVAVYRKN